MALPHLDSIWLTCADALAIPVHRGGDSYVHFDGNVLHVSSDDTLDADDSLAQLVLHEICHLLVAGPDMRHTADWGLDNTGADAFDEERERAAVRLQAHLAGAHGLRGHLFPTTGVRPFFEELPDDALVGESPSAQLARSAATRAGHAPFEGALSRALHATALASAIPLHQNGAALRTDRRCGECAWRADEGRCVASDIVVRADDTACSRFQSGLDCMACGACCRSGYDVVHASADELVGRRHPALVVRHEPGFDLRRVSPFGEDRCIALAGRGALCLFHLRRSTERVR